MDVTLNANTRSEFGLPRPSQAQSMSTTGDVRELSISEIDDVNGGLAPFVAGMLVGGGLVVAGALLAWATR